MFKAGKSTHLTIIATFAIVFIVIYLYYTITDLRKLQIEVGKLSKQVADLKVSGAYCPMPQTHHAPTPTPVMTFEPMMQMQEHQDDEDNNSVNTEEIKNILDRQDSEKLEHVELEKETTPEPDTSAAPAITESVEQQPEPVTNTKTVNVKSTSKRSKAAK